MDASIKPPLYTLVDLMNDKIEQKYYADQLVKAPNPNYEKDIFEIEKVLKTKVVNKKKYYLVKYMYYPNKFNEYISEDNLITGSDSSNVD